MSCPENKIGEPFLWLFRVYPHNMLTQLLEARPHFGDFKQYLECEYCGAREQQYRDDMSLQRSGFNIRRLCEAMLDRQVDVEPSLDRDQLLQYKILKK